MSFASKGEFYAAETKPENILMFKLQDRQLFLYIQLHIYVNMLLPQNIGVIYGNVLPLIMMLF